jgi:type I restriction enzyme S subunit
LRNAISRTQREIALLREYLTRLIADVVTGKLDVREAAAKLPDEAEEPEPSEEDDALSESEEYSNEDLDGGSKVTEEVGM